ncbi:Unknown protein [Striga hermonthica]|uniref:F-box domain-containing protein n=1 Tax=Striga hermonthica TaxID=68872 RepID=A0A9N7MGG4_STRHE|nr:Unknown protein [Striga hermonthica]
MGSNGTSSAQKRISNVLPTTISAVNGRRPRFGPLPWKAHPQTARTLIPSSDPKRPINLKRVGSHLKCVERYHDDDVLSLLPDDILLVILSSLPLKEAGRTSVLSSRWRYLWSYTSYLNFDDHSSMEQIIHDEDFCLVEREREKYVRWVDSVLQSHRGFSLKELRICFSLTQSPSITKWVEFAFKRHIEKLELNFTHCDPPDESYVFHQELLRENSGIFNYKTLKVLCLRDINVSGEAMEFLLRYCPLLEQIVVCFSQLLTSLEVCGPSLVLKHLEIWRCNYLKSLRISAPNLTTLILNNKIESLLLEDVPMLRDVYVNIGDHPLDHMYVQRLVPTLRCCLSQLEILTLNIYQKKEVLKMLNFPMMPKLRKLVVVKLLYGVDWSLLDVAHFINASPNLQEFELKQQWSEAERSNREIQKGFKQFPLHQHLNVFRFLGYYGCPSDVELVNYLLESCVALKEIIVDTQSPARPAYGPVDPEDLKLAEEANIYAKQQLEPLLSAPPVAGDRCLAGANYLHKRYHRHAGEEWLKQEGKKKKKRKGKIGTCTSRRQCYHPRWNKPGVALLDATLHQRRRHGAAFQKPDSRRGSKASRARLALWRYFNHW